MHISVVRKFVEGCNNKNKMIVSEDIYTFGLLDGQGLRFFLMSKWLGLLQLEMQVEVVTL